MTKNQTLLANLHARQLRVLKACIEANDLEQVRIEHEILAEIERELRESSKKEGGGARN